MSVIVEIVFLYEVETLAGTVVFFFDPSTFLEIWRYRLNTFAVFFFSLVFKLFPVFQ